MPIIKKLSKSGTTSISGAIGIGPCSRGRGVVCFRHGGREPLRRHWRAAAPGPAGMPAIGGACTGMSRDHSAMRGGIASGSRGALVFISVAGYYTINAVDLRAHKSVKIRYKRAAKGYGFGHIPSSYRLRAFVCHGFSTQRNPQMNRSNESAWRSLQFRRHSQAMAG